MSFWSSLLSLFTSKPKPPSTFACWLTVVTPERQLVSGLIATLTIETPPALPPIVGAYVGDRVRFLVPIGRAGNGAYLSLSAPGYAPPAIERIAAVPEMGERKMTAQAAPPTPHAGAWTKNQIADIQGDLMIFCPEIAPNFVDGVDPETGIRAQGDNGATAHGLVQGWVWWMYLWCYPKAKREIFYAKVKALGHTHGFVQVTQAGGPGTGYHGTRHQSQEDVDRAGLLSMTIHQEILDHGLIPVCTGLGPFDALATGFDPKVAICAMNDWDNDLHMAGRIKLCHDTFPSALIFCELPGPSQGYPDSDANDPIPATSTNGGEWIRAMQQRYPRFIGVLHEVNLWEGIDQAAAYLSQCHPWWRDVQEVRFEMDTYAKFWSGGNPEDFGAANDVLQARCPWLKGFASGGSTHPAPAGDTGPVTVPTGAADMIDPTTITFVDNPADEGSFSITAKITSVQLRPDAMIVEFDKRLGPGAWPNRAFEAGQPPPADGGGIQYTLGLCFNIGGRWYASAAIQFWQGRDLDGAASPSSIPQTWFYDGRWAPMNGYLPQDGEPVGFFVVAGNVRGLHDGSQATRERSNIVLVPFKR